MPLGRFLPPCLRFFFGSGFSSACSASARFDLGFPAVLFFDFLPIDLGEVRGFKTPSCVSKLVIKALA